MPYGRSKKHFAASPYGNRPYGEEQRAIRNTVLRADLSKQKHQRQLFSYHPNLSSRTHSLKSRVLRFLCNCPRLFRLLPSLGIPHHPLPLRTTDMVKSKQGVILFVEPDLDTITWYADFRRQCLVELTNFLLLNCAFTRASRIAGDTSMGTVQPVLGGLIETQGALRLAAKLCLRYLLKTILFLHLKLRQEALQKQKSTSFRIFLLGC